jgi:hypothetical protein
MLYGAHDSQWKGVGVSKPEAVQAKTLFEVWRLTAACDPKRSLELNSLVQAMRNF